MNFLTDGYWVWTDASAYYLERYALRPDPELVEHIHARGYQTRRWTGRPSIGRWPFCRRPVKRSRPGPSADRTYWSRRSRRKRRHPIGWRRFLVFLLRYQDLPIQDGTDEDAVARTGRSRTSDEPDTDDDKRRRQQAQHDNDQDHGAGRRIHASSWL